MIKNFTVVVRQIRNSGVKKKYNKIRNAGGQAKYQQIKNSGKKVKNGFINHVNYLVDKNRPSHQNTKIKLLLNNADNILSAIEERKAYRKEKSLSGGGVVNYATSFVCVVPNDINQPHDIKEWYLIALQVIRDISKTTNLSFDLIKKHTHIVLHDESASIDKHSHLHILVSNVINNEVVKVISQRKTTYAVKTGFNRSIKRVLHEDHKNYVAKKSGSKNKPLWLARLEKNIQLENNTKSLEIEIKQKKIKLSKINNALTLLAQNLIKIKNEISDWADDFLNNFFSEAEKKANSVATILNDIELISEKEADKLDKTIRQIEDRNLDAPSTAKVSSKRKNWIKKNKNI